MSKNSNKARNFLTRSSVSNISSFDFVSAINELLDNILSIISSLISYIVLYKFFLIILLSTIRCLIITVWMFDSYCNAYKKLKY